jgi:hypothetical protein
VPVDNYFNFDKNSVDMAFIQDSKVGSDELQSVLSGQVDLIASQILARKAEVKESGLLGGKAGIALFFAYLAKAFPEKQYLQNTLDYLDELSEALSNEEMNYSMSAGSGRHCFCLSAFAQHGHPGCR